MRLLVTGGAGFIGSSLAMRLASDHSVTVLDNAPESIDTLRSNGIRTLSGDVRDASCVSDVARQQDAIFHFAAVVGVPHAMNRQWDSLTTTTVGTTNVLLAARHYAIPVFIASSSAVYGKIREVRVKEEDDIVLGNTDKPSWTYSTAKLTEELLALAAYTDLGVSVKIGRFFNVIGPGQSDVHGMVVPRLVDRALRGEPLPVYGDGTQTRTFVDVEDALDGLLLVWNQGDWGRAYNIGGIDEIRIVDLALRVKALTASSSPIEFQPFASVFGRNFEETMRRAPDIERLRQLGYQPRRTLDDTLSRVIAWRSKLQ